MKIEEGEAIINNETAKVVSKDLPVFYNPVMKFNRDISILLLNVLYQQTNNPLQACDLMAGSGIRSIRFLKELPNNIINHLTINDKDPETYKRIKQNLKANNLGFEEWSRDDLIEASLKRDGPRDITNKSERPIVNLPKVMTTNLDANFLLMISNGYDYIDIDPFGSPNPFLDQAVKRIARDGILAVTATDTSGLAGSHPKACIRKYWATPVNNARKHEVGLRILIRKCQLIGAQFEKALTPILSYSKDHYYRIFFKAEKGKTKVDKLLKEHGVWEQEPNAGPLWLGKYIDEKLLQEMIAIEKDEKTKIFLQKLLDDNSFEKIPYYHYINDLKKNLKVHLNKEKLRELLPDYKDTHHDTNCFRTSKSEEEIRRSL